MTADLRQRVCDVALSMVGVPWAHQGRSRRRTDCVGLLIFVARETGLVDPLWQPPPYPRQPDGSLISYFDQHCVRIPRDRVNRGSIAVFDWGTRPCHAGIVIDPQRRSMVHAHAGARRVVVDIFENDVQNDGRRLHACFDYRGIDDG